MFDVSREYLQIDPLHEAVPNECCHSVVTIGNFDGVHRGHQALVGLAKKLARQYSTSVVAVAFDPPPAALLRPKHPYPPLTTLPRRTALLREAGADQVVVFRTTRQFLELSAAEFVERVIVRGFQAIGVVEGENFRFGRDREGNVETLRSLAEAWGIPVVACSPVVFRGQPVSSSRIRGALREGDVHSAAAMLGRPYVITGKVVPGAGRGRSLGFPTANLAEIPTLVPGTGVYAGVARPYGERSYPAAIHIGAPVTFDATDIVVEVHLIGFEGDLVGAELAVAFYERLRDTTKFPSVEALKRQLEQDTLAAKDVVRRWQCPDLSPSPEEA